MDNAQIDTVIISDYSAVDSASQLRAAYCTSNRGKDEFHLPISYCVDLAGCIVRSNTEHNRGRYEQLLAEDMQHIIANYEAQINQEKENVKQVEAKANLCQQQLQALNHAFNQYQDNVKNITNDIRNHLARKRTIESQLQTIREANQIDISPYEQERDELLSQIAEQENKIKEINIQLEIKGNEVRHLEEEKRGVDKQKIQVDRRIEEQERNIEQFINDREKRLRILNGETQKREKVLSEVTKQQEIVDQCVQRVELKEAEARSRSRELLSAEVWNGVDRLIIRPKEMNKAVLQGKIDGYTQQLEDGKKKAGDCGGQDQAGGDG